MTGLRHITKEVRAAFPELNRLRIDVGYKSMNDAFFQCGTTSSGFCISVDQTLKDAPPDVLRGGLAHDLAHIARDSKLKPVMAFFDNLLYGLFPPYNSWLERATDKDVIRRGYGRELLAFAEYVDSHGYSHEKDVGLSPVEIKNVLAQGKGELPWRVRD